MMSTADGPSKFMPQLFRSSARQHSFAGWVRVENDGVIRGWVTDRNDRSSRFDVQVVVDGALIASPRADRLDAKVKELGEGDGAYAFAAMIPQAYRDGLPHTFEAVVGGGAFKLKSKQQTFTVPSESGLPQVEVFQADWTGMRGVISARVPAASRLELWADGARVSEPLETTWEFKRDRSNFAVKVSPERMAALQDRALRLALPGMEEAGLPGAELKAPATLQAALRADGELALTVVAVHDLFAENLQLRFRDGDGATVQDLPVSFSDRQARVQLTSDLTRARWVSLIVDGYEPPSLRARIRRRLPLTGGNGDFAIWSADGPDGWETPFLSAAERGFHAFPQRIADAYGVSGHYMRLSVAAATREQLLLRRTLAEQFTDFDCGDLALIARTSRPARLNARLRDPEGSQIASLDLDASHPWVWSRASELVQLDRAVEGLVLELAIQPFEGEPLDVEVAGLRFGGDAFSEGERPQPTSLSSQGELLVNAALEAWPTGLFFETGASRVETARGWSVVNRDSAEPTRVRALLSGDGSDPDEVAFGWAAAEVPAHCRLDVRLTDRALEGFEEGLLRFTAASTAGARRLLAQSARPAPAFSVIGRVMLVRRITLATAKGPRTHERVVTTIARRLLVTRTPHAFELPVRIEHTPLSELLEAVPDGEAEHLLVFQFQQPFAVALSRVSLRAEAVSRSESAPYLRLEDRAIAAQVEHTRGLESWTRPQVALPVAPARPEASSAPKVWRWSRAAMGSVEIVVCVHNAPDETLACLASVSATTEVPHTVHVIDDASDPSNAERVAAFVAGRPWMRLTRHDANQGYTSSADEGVRAADSDWVVLLNSDTVLTPGWLEGLLEVAASDPDIAFVGPVSNAATFQSVPELYGPDGKFAVNALPPGWSPADMAALVRRVSDHDFPETPLLNGFCTLMKRTAVLALGGFNTEAFPAGYGEENDLCTRAVKAGMKLAIADHVYVHHVKSASFGGERRNELSKAGGKALRELHPDVDFGALTAAFRDRPSLVRLRQAVRSELEAAGG